MARCETCDRYFKSLGIARHRAMHRDKREDCVITTKEGTFKYLYSDRKPKA